MQTGGIIIISSIVRLFLNDSIHKLDSLFLLPQFQVGILRTRTIARNSIQFNDFFIVCLR